ncbi:hypothetical protein AB0I82_35500 [Streptomyces sp. NPDC050315]|uniref:hypothetical protein n=1 Tax=Streptomyces sp. NPDC050315 TaxID=3155039 RepID=UPI00343BD9B5
MLNFDDKPASVTLYSGPNHTGESCVLNERHSDETYSLKATGLDKIASIKVQQPAAVAAPFSIFVRLYLERPQGLVDKLGPGSEKTVKDFHEDVADTGDGAKAAYVRVLTRMGNTVREIPNVIASAPEGERTIHDTIPR